MKKLLAFIGILAIVFISNTIQASCVGDLQNGSGVQLLTCSVSPYTYESSDGGRFYCSYNQPLNISEHCVWSGLSGYNSFASASCDGDPNTVETTADSSNQYPYNSGNLTAFYGSIDLYVNTQNSGSAYGSAYVEASY